MYNDDKNKSGDNAVDDDSYSNKSININSANEKCEKYSNNKSKCNEVNGCHFKLNRCEKIVKRCEDIDSREYCEKKKFTKTIINPKKGKPLKSLQSCKWTPRQLKKGDIVRAKKIEGSAEYYPATIKKINSDGSYDIEFSDGSTDPLLSEKVTKDSFDTETISQCRENNQLDLSSNFTKRLKSFLALYYLDKIKSPIISSREDIKNIPASTISLWMPKDDPTNPNYKGESMVKSLEDVTNTNMYTPEKYMFSLKLELHSYNHMVIWAKKNWQDLLRESSNKRLPVMIYFANKYKRRVKSISTYKSNLKTRRDELQKYYYDNQKELGEKLGEENNVIRNLSKGKINELLDIYSIYDITETLYTEFNRVPENWAKYIDSPPEWISKLDKELDKLKNEKGGIISGTYLESYTED